MFDSAVKLNAFDQLKATTRKVLPASIYQHVSKVMRGAVGIYPTLKTVSRMGVPDVLLYFGSAPGDDLLCTAVLREISKRRSGKLWMMSNHPDLFEGNMDAAQVVPINGYLKNSVHLLGTGYHHLKYAPKCLFDNDRSLPPQLHIIAELCLRAGIRGEVALRPYFHLREKEQSQCSWAREMIAIQSSGLAARFPMQNKEWFPERFQHVVDRLLDHYGFVQIGSKQDPPLTNVIDLRGKTTIREVAGLLTNCRLYIGNVGFLMHLARAVECPAVIVFGGREAPWQSGYSCNINLFSELSCAPCWLWNTCPHDRLCMRKIAVPDVVEAVRAQLAKPRGPLTVDRVEV